VLQGGKVLHRDVKPGNILFHNSLVKLADFGFCKSLRHEWESSHTMVGSPLYMSPELINGQEYGLKADVWSVGCVLFECLYGRAPFEEGSMVALLERLNSSEVEFPASPSVSPKTQALMRMMLTKDASQRADWDALGAYYQRHFREYRE